MTDFSSIVPSTYAFFPADDVAFIRKDADFGDAELYMVGIAQVDIAQVGVAQVGIAQVGTMQVGVAQVGTMQAVISMLFEDGFDVVAFESAVWRGDFHWLSFCSLALRGVVRRQEPR